jgi:methylthioribose-1-phosphate isomerase
MNLPLSVEWKENQLIFLDQTKLPTDVIFEVQESMEQVWQSIKVLKVRGAPAIGVAGAYGFYLGIKENINLSYSEILKKADEIVSYLDSSRPTAVNLKWALDRMRKVLDEKELTGEALLERVLTEAINIHEEDKKLCRGIGESGVDLIKEGMGVLTHCNAGSLAVSQLGTALAPMYLAHEKGVKFRVYADETRPLLQGSRLTAWELQQAGIDVTVNTDNMAAHLMSEGLIDLVIVGTDRVAANGDVANKIGTLGVAILCKHFGIPFYVACPSSTIDFNTTNGKDIVIEERGSEEVCHFGEKRTAPFDIKTRNPAFDVTPHELVSGLITEKGLFEYPYSEKMKQAFL